MTPEELQKEIHSYVDIVLDKNKSVRYDSAYKASILMKLSEIISRLEKLESK